MGHADTLTRDQVAAVDDMAALSGTIRDAVAAARMAAIAAAL